MSSTDRRALDLVGPTRDGTPADSIRQRVGGIAVDASSGWCAAVRWIEAQPAFFVFAVAAVLRIACVLWLGHVPYAQGGDAPRYVSLAADIVNLHGYGITSGDATRVPLYPLFVAAHLWIFGGLLISVAVSQAILDAATAVVITWTAAALGAGRRAWVPGTMWATYPPAILNTVVIFTQPLQVFFLVSATWMVLAGIKSQSTWRCTAAAVLWGLACLTRAGNLLFLPVFATAPVLCWTLRGPRTTAWALKTSALMFVCGAASVLWWTARDFPQTYRLQDLALNSKERRAIEVLISPFQPLPDNIAAWLRQHAQMFRPNEGPLILPSGDEQVEATMRDWGGRLRTVRAKLWLTFSAPDGCVQLACPGLQAGYWATVSRSGGDPADAVALAFSRPCLALKALMYLEHYALLLLAVPGFVLLARRAPGVGLLLLVYVVYTVISIVLGSNYSNTLVAVPRYGFSIMPVVVFVASWLFVSRHGHRTQGLRHSEAPVQ